MLTHILVGHREIDGQVYVGDVKEKESAKEQYEKAVSSGKTAGLVKYTGIRLRLNIPTSTLNLQ